MKMFPLTIPYRVMEADRTACPTDADVTRFLIRACVISQHEAGMEPFESRIWAKLQPRLDAAKDCVELDFTEYDWLRAQLRDWKKIPVRLAEWYWTFMDAFEVESKEIEPSK